MIKKVFWVILCICMMHMSVSYAEEWSSHPIMSERDRDFGIIGGEGCQWPHCMGISRANPDFLLCGIDVQGLYKSADGGETWYMSNRGVYSKGVTAVAFDPKNGDRALCVGIGSLYNGVYLTEDAAVNWSYVNEATTLPAGLRDYRRQISFDPTSYDENLGYCTRAYWLQRYRAGSVDTGYIFYDVLWRSDDGGQSWSTENIQTPECGKAELAVNEKTGRIYIAGLGGLFISDDCGKSFTKISSEEFTGVDISVSRPELVMATTEWGLRRSEDYGDTFFEYGNALPVKPDPMPASFSGRGYRDLAISPADENYMMIMCGEASFAWRAWYSHDGGLTWTKSQINRIFTYYPYNGREKMFAMHPEDKNIVVTFGGDLMMKSSDGGKMFVWSNSGYCASLVASYKFNIHDPNLVFTANRDYNGSVSFDGGVTYSYANVQNNTWGGYVWSGYTASKDYIFAIGYTRAKQEDGTYQYYYHLYESTDQGKTFKQREDVEIKQTHYANIYNCMQAKNNKNVLFAQELRSEDMGKTWSVMDGCVSVLTYNQDPNGGGELFGVAGDMNQVVMSKDDGKTWEVLIRRTTADLGEDAPYVSGMAYDYKRGDLYVAAVKGLFRININTRTSEKVAINADSHTKEARAGNVCIDMYDPDIIYVTANMNNYNYDASVQRSVDGGRTWQIISTAHPDSIIEQEGCYGDGATIAVVNPKNRYFYSSGACSGLEQIGPPGSEPDYSEPVTAVVSDDKASVYVNWFGNGRMTAEQLAEHAYYASVSEVDSVWKRLTYNTDDVSGVIDEKDIDNIAYYMFEDWDKPKDLYELYRSENGTDFEKITEASEITDYTDLDIESGKTYYYKVKNISKQTFTMTAKARIE
ncbi:MAG: hypothetical protein ACI4DY_08970 [Monoglobaceae bacterium]